MNSPLSQQHDVEQNKNSNLAFLCYKEFGKTMNEINKILFSNRSEVAILNHSRFAKDYYFTDSVE